VGFLAPWFLAGLAAVGLPVWLHLLRRHRNVPVPFSSLRFFERRTQSSVRHRRLRYLLLFALRTLVLVLLALAFASPFIERAGGPAAGSRRMVVLAIDDSFSMRHGGRLARAKEEAARVASGMAGEAEGQVLAFASGVRTITTVTSDSAELQEGIRAIEAGDARGSYAELVRALRSIVQAANVPVEVHVFSDMQKSSLPPNFADLALPAGVRVVTHPVAEAAANAAVESVRAPRGIYGQGRAVVSATVANFGPSVETRRAALFMNGREVESRSVEIPAAGRAEVEFAGVEVPFGFSRCEVRIEPADELAEDDRFHFSIERADPRPALFVHEPNHTRGLLYFRAALEAAAQAAFQLEPVTADRTATVDPAHYAFVVLSDVAAIPEAFDAALKRYVEGGGSVWIALGRMGAARGRLPVTGETIAETRYFARDSIRFQTAAPLDASHPAVARSGRWDGVRFYQAVRLDAGDARVPARLSDGTPLLIDRTLGEGRVLVFASTFDNIANDLPLHAAFVPFVEQTARYLGRLEEGQAGYTVDAHYELGERAGAAAEVLGPDGKRLLSLDEAARAATLPLTRAGFYDIKRPDGRRDLVAVNADRRESDLELIPPETLALWSGAQDAPAGSAGSVAAEESRPFELWWYVMLALLALAAAESWIGNRHLTVEREPEEQAVRKEAA
jgi:hypothetical protein